MASVITVQNLIDYYVNLLIIQYNDKPNARSTIAAFAEVLEANGILLDIQNAYNIETAVGVQLDVIGKYAGVDRFYKSVDLTDYFSLETYDEGAPSSPPRYGFTDYSLYDYTPPKGTLTYDDLIGKNNILDDDNYRFIIKLKILQNNINHSYKEIDEGMFFYFGTTVRPESSGGMHMFYFVTRNLTVLIQAAIYKKLLPNPMGVGIIIVNDVTDHMFAFTDYSGYESPYGYGFSDYSDYDTLPGQVLTYNQISQG